MTEISVYCYEGVRHLDKRSLQVKTKVWGIVTLPVEKVVELLVSVRGGRGANSVYGSCKKH